MNKLYKDDNSLEQKQTNNQINNQISEQANSSKSLTINKPIPKETVFKSNPIDEETKKHTIIGIFVGLSIGLLYWLIVSII